MDLVDRPSRMAAALAATMLFSIGPSIADDGKIDPTDPTNIIFQMTPAYEYTKLAGGGGETHTLSLDTWIPLTDQDLLTIELRGVISEYPGLPTESGVGDIRARYFHLISTPDAGILRAWAPSFDLIIPTGNASRGLGGGSWLLMPNFLLALQFTPTIAAYPFFRYVHSIPAGGPAGVLTSALPELDIPVDDPSLPGLLGFSTPQVRALNIEVPISFTLSDELFFTATPNYFHNFAEGGSATFSSKFQLTWAPIPTAAFGIEANVPFAGNNAFDYAIKPTVTFYF